jgi:NAD(P) transhydrogenase
MSIDTSRTSYDLIVIGTGPGGEGAAMKAAKSGLAVAGIERFNRVGGGCVHWGTIPSKALRRAIYSMDLLHKSPLYKRMDIVPTFDLPELLATANEVIESQTDLREGFYDRTGVRLIPGSARFVDPHTIEVDGAHECKERFTARGFIIATGSRPYRPADIDFNHPRIVDSDTLLRLNRTPSSFTVYGAGVVGCEYASMLNRMGCSVNLIDTRETLLPFLDEEISDALSYHFADQGILIRHNETYEKVEAFDDCVIVHLRSGKKIKSDTFLFASGRSGNTENLGLESLNIVPDKHGCIPVNGDFQTSQPHIYAVGDIVGPPSLASASYDQGRYAAEHFATGKCDHHLVEDVPSGIYTLPEISSVGKTEAQLTAEKVPYEVGKAPFKTLARAQITGETVGMLKILFHRETLALLGVHCFGENAAEIVHIGQAIMCQKGDANTLKYFVNTTFNYPTMAEAYRVAALNGLGRVF